MWHSHTLKYRNKSEGATKNIKLHELQKKKKLCQATEAQNTHTKKSRYVNNLYETLEQGKLIYNVPKQIHGGGRQQYLKGQG